MTEASKIKKRLSPDLLKVVNRVLDQYPGLFSIRDENQYEIYIADKDSSSDFFFAVKKESSDKNGHYLEYSRKPYSANNRAVGSVTQKLSDFENNFKEWFNNLQTYNEPSPIDDILLRGYQEEFYDDFKIIEEDADQKGFSYSQQLKLVGYLNDVVDKIEGLKNDKNSEVIDDIKSEASTLATEITTETKNGTMKRLCRLWAKGRKSGLKVSEFMLKEFVEEFLKEGAKSFFNFTVKNAHKIPEYIEHITTNIHLLP